MGTDSNVSILIPEQLVSSMVAAEIVRQFPDKQKFAEGIIESMLRVKENSYDRETLLQKQVAAAVRDMAKTVFDEWLRENTEAIRKALMSRLTTQKGRLVASIADSIVANMFKLMVSTSLNVEERSRP